MTDHHVLQVMIAQILYFRTLAVYHLQRPCKKGLITIRLIDYVQFAYVLPTSGGEGLFFTLSKSKSFLTRLPSSCPSFLQHAFLILSRVLNYSHPSTSLSRSLLSSL